MEESVLVIDDEPDHSRLLGTLLHGLGLTVYTAANGPDGVDAIRRLNPALITTDLTLPGFGGAEVIRQARAFTSAPIMIVSASSDILEVEAGLGAGADAYLPKPFRPRVLRAYVQALRGPLQRRGGEPAPEEVVCPSM
jgi:DNA-binding response OmpR family regulator